ncbi:hypothetical protein ABPG74_002596 [Tetrahymena malaccensis]
MKQLALIFALSFLACLQASQIPHCIKYLAINNELICTQCFDGFVLSFNFRSCIGHNVDYLKLCRRVNDLGLCEEAIDCNMQLDQNYKYIDLNQFQYDINCAQVDTVNKICLSPKFPYSLEISQNTIMLLNNYCKISKNGNCQEYYTVDACYSGQQLFQKYNNKPNLPFCKKSFQFGDHEICFQCQEGAFFIDKKYCQPCLPINSFYNLINNQGMNCFVKANQLNLIYMPDSALFPKNCEIFNINSNSVQCVQCVNNDQNYFNVANQRCQQRQFSKNCLTYNPISDQCLTVECQNGYYFHNQLFQQAINQYYINQKYQKGILMEEIFSEYFTDKQSSNNFNFNVLQAYQSLYPVYLNLTDYGYKIMNDIFYTQNINYEICTSDFPQLASNYMLNRNFQCSQSQFYMIQQQFPEIQCGHLSPIQQNCLVLDSNNLCIRCQSGYYLVINQCYQGQVFQNCLWQNQDQCKLCLKGTFNQMNQQCLFPSYPFTSVYVSNISQQCQQQALQNIFPQTQQANCSDCFQRFVQYISQQCSLQGFIDNNCVYQAPSYTYQMNQPLQSIFYQSCSSTSYFCQMYRQVSTWSQCNINYYCNSCFQNQCLDNYVQFYSQTCHTVQCPAVQATCPITKCPRGFVYSKLYQGCYLLCLDDKINITNDPKYCFYVKRCDIMMISSNQYQCPYCDLANSLDQCLVFKQQCDVNHIYSYQYNQCLYYCNNANGILAVNEQDCTISKICQDGLIWIENLKACVYFCEQGQIAYGNTSCSQSKICIENKIWSIQYQKCVEKQSTFSTQSILLIVLGCAAFTVILLILLFYFHEKHKLSKYLYSYSQVEHNPNNAVEKET